MADFYDTGFNAGYKAGWAANDEYRRDKRLLDSATAMGRMLFMLIGMLFCSLNAVLIAKHESIWPFVDIDIIMLCLIGIGILVDKIERRVYNRNKEAFNEKWKSVNG